MKTGAEQLHNYVNKPSLTFKDLGGNDNRIISLEDEANMDNKIQELTNYIANNHGLNKTDAEKDDLYDTAMKLRAELAIMLRDNPMMMYFNRKEFNWLTDLLINKNKYTVDTVFDGLHLTNMLNEWSNLENKFKNNNDKVVYGFPVTPTELTIIYHLISKHEVVGIKSATYTFAEVLKRIGGVSKVIKYYDTHSKSLEDAVNVWAASFEPELVPETAAETV